MPETEAAVGVEAVQAWRRATFAQANQLCARANVIIDFYAVCVEDYKAVSTDRLDKVAAALTNQMPELRTAEGLPLPGEKMAAFAVKQADAAVRTAALNFFHVAIEETVHACLRMGAALRTATVMDWQKNKQLRLADVLTKTTKEIEQHFVDRWLKETLSGSLPEKISRLNALLPPTEETVVDFGFIGDLDEARHDSIHRGGLKEAAAFNLDAGRMLAFGTCSVLIDRVLDAALPDGWRDREAANRGKAPAQG